MGIRWRPEIAAGLERLVAGAPGFAAFDWDNTCVRGDVEETLLAWYDRQDGGRRMDEYAARCAQSLDDGFTWAAVASVVGRSESDVAFSVDAAVDWGLATGRLGVRTPLVVLVAQLRTAGWDVRVVTASAAAVVRVAARRYGFSPGQVIGVEVARGSDGRFVDRVEPPLTWRAGKVEAIRRVVRRMPDLAVGDTATDIEMLSASRFALLLDRGNAEARAAAAAGGWWIQPADDDPGEDPWVTASSS